MFKRINIQRFRSCDLVVLDDLGPTTALVGRNGVGKTNILRAVDWMARTATSRVALRAVSNHHISAEFFAGGTHYAYDLQGGFVRGPDKRPVRNIDESLGVLQPSGSVLPIFDRRGESLTDHVGKQALRLSLAGPAMPAMEAILPTDSAILTHVRAVSSFLRSTRYYNLDDSSDEEVGLLREHELRKWVADYETVGSPTDSVDYKLLYIKLERPDIYEQLLALTGSQGLRILHGIDLFSVSTKADDEKMYSLRFRPNLNSSRHFPFESLSFGTRRVLRLLAAILVDKNAVMLLEHPEDGIHRGLLRLLLDVLRTNTENCQFIVTSHSGVVFDSLTPSQTRLVSMDHGKTRVRSLSEQERAAAVRFLEQDGSMADFLETVQGEE